MARLQILQLPAGTGDERPPWLLIVDELPTGDAQLDMLRRDLADNDITARIGARGALCFESTVDIPANEALPLPLLSVQGDSQTAELIHAHEQTRLALCDALLLSPDSTWAQITETAEQRQRELAGLYKERDALAEVLRVDRAADWSAFSNAITRLVKEHDGFRWRLGRVRQTPTTPNLMDSRQKHPDVWKHGYECGVRSVRAAAWPGDEETSTP